MISLFGIGTVLTFRDFSKTELTPTPAMMKYFRCVRPLFYSYKNVIVDCRHLVLKNKRLLGDLNKLVEDF